MEWVYSKLQATRPKLVRYARSRLNDNDDIADVLADTYLGIVEYMERHDDAVPASWRMEASEAVVSATDESRLEKLTFTILKRRIFERYRHKQRFNEVLTAQAEDALDLSMEMSASNSVDRDMLMLEIGEVVLNAVANLEPEHRALILQDRGEPRTTRERVKLSRLRRRLREVVNRELGESIEQLLKDR